jgi:ribose transport system substrate-binding protein
MYRRTRLVGLVALAALPLAACSSGSSSGTATSSAPAAASSAAASIPASPVAATSSAAAGPKKIILLMPLPCASSDYWKSLCAGAAEQAKQNPDGITYEVKALPTIDVNAFINLINTTVQAEHPAAIAVVPPSATAILPAVQAAVKAGTKVVFLDSNVPGLQADETAYVGTDNLAAGKAAGQWLVDNASKAKTKTVGMVLNPPGIQSTDERATGFKQVVEAAGFKIAAQQVLDGNCDVNVARNTVQNFLTAHSDLGVVFSICDPDAMGAAQALVAAKKTDVLNIGIDGQPSAVQLIVDKKGYNADIAQNPYKIGTLGVKAMADAVQGLPVDKRIDTGIRTIDAANAQAYLDAGGR